jgi:hypothetical protein
MSLWRTGRIERGALALALALALVGCGDEEQDPYLPTGEGRVGGTPGGDNNGEVGENNGEGPLPTALAPGELAFLRDNTGGTELLTLIDDQPAVLARLTDADGGDVNVGPGDLAVSGDGVRVLYSVGGALLSAQLDGKEVQALLSAQGQPFATISRPRPTPDGGAVIFVGDGGAIYRLTLATGAAQDLNVSLGTCDTWGELVVVGSAQGYATRGGCADATDAGLFAINFSTGGASPVATATELIPGATVRGVAASGDLVYFWGSGALDLNGDTAPDTEDREALYTWNARLDTLVGAPAFFANGQAQGRGLAPLGAGAVAVDLVQPNNQAMSGLYRLDTAAGTFSALTLGTDLSSPATR